MQKEFGAEVCAGASKKAGSCPASNTVPTWYRRLFPICALWGQDLRRRLRAEVPGVNMLIEPHILLSPHSIDKIDHDSESSETLKFLAT